MLEVLIGHLQIMLSRHRPRIADPRADDMLRPPLTPFCLPSGSEILKQLRPGLQPSLPENPEELGSQVAVGVSVFGDDVDSPGLRRFEGIPQ